MLEAIGTILIFAGQVGFAFLVLTLVMLIVAHGLEWLERPRAAFPVTFPPAEESLEETLARLKRAAGPNFIDPVRESRLAEIRDPTIHQPTDESRAVYAAHVKAEARARKRRIRRERVARVKAALRAAYRAIVRYFNSIGN